MPSGLGCVRTRGYFTADSLIENASTPRRRNYTHERNTLTCTHSYRYFAEEASAHIRARSNFGVAYHANHVYAVIKSVRTSARERPGRHDGALKRGESLELGATASEIDHKDAIRCARTCENIIHTCCTCCFALQIRKVLPRFALTARGALK